MSRRSPNRAARIRDAHRTWLTIHFVVAAIALIAAFVMNRFLTPDHFWAHWVALGWGIAFVIHLGVFARATLATMGGQRGGSRQG